MRDIGAWGPGNSLIGLGLMHFSRTHMSDHGYETGWLTPQPLYGMDKTDWRYAYLHDDRGERAHALSLMLSIGVFGVAFCLTPVLVAGS